MEGPSRGFVGIACSLCLHTGLCGKKCEYRYMETAGIVGIALGTLEKRNLLRHLSFNPQRNF